MASTTLTGVVASRADLSIENDAYLPLGVHATMLFGVSEAATALFKTIVTAYLAAGSPNRLTHHFERAQMTDAHRELENSGLVQRVFGVAGGFAWRLTEAGVEQIQKNP